MKVFLLVVLLLGAIDVVAQTQKSTVVNPEETAEFTVANSGHTARLVLTSKPFIPARHKIVRTKDCLTIDGRVPIGTDAEFPERRSLR